MAKEEETPEDAEIEEGEEGEEPKKKKLSGKTLVLFIILPVVLLALVGGGAMMFLGGGDEEAQHADAAADGDPQHAAMLDPTQVIFYELPELLVNLSNSGSRATFLKLEVTLELQKDQEVAMLEAALPRVVDKFQVYLRELRMEDLSGAAGTQRVKEELLRRVNLAAQPVVVNAVLVKEMVVQ